MNHHAPTHTSVFVWRDVARQNRRVHLAQVYTLLIVRVARLDALPPPPPAPTAGAAVPPGGAGPAGEDEGEGDGGMERFRSDRCFPNTHQPNRALQ